MEDLPKDDVRGFYADMTMQLIKQLHIKRYNLVVIGKLELCLCFVCHTRPFIVMCPCTHIRLQFLDHYGHFVASRCCC